MKKKQNQLTFDNYYRALNNGEITKELNINLQLRNEVMSKITIGKNALTPAMTKYRVTEDFKTYIPLKTKTGEKIKL
jgi:hypothetical protein